jgi:hypothetical protein
MKHAFAALLAFCIATSHADELNSAAKRYRVSFDRPPAGWPLNEPFKLAFKVLSTPSASVIPADLSIQVDATMPAHRHGSNLAPVVRQVGTGEYEIAGLLLHMVGDWQIKLTMTSGTFVDEVVIPVALR